MSSMLDQAIIDANELKEAAIRNAESTLIEKYSVDIKEAVEQLLEQPDPAALLAALGAPPGGDPMAGGPAPPAPGPMPGQAEEPEFSKQISFAATEGEDLCPCPEEGATLVVDLDKMAADLQGAEEVGEPAPSELIASEVMGGMPAPGAPPEGAEEQFLVQESVLMSILEESEVETYEEEVEVAEEGKKKKKGKKKGDDDRWHTGKKEEVLEVDLDEALDIQEEDTLEEDDDIFEDIELEEGSQDQPAPTVTGTETTGEMGGEPAVPVEEEFTADAGTVTKYEEQLKAYNHYYNKLYESHTRYEQEYKNLYNEYEKLYNEHAKNKETHTKNEEKIDKVLKENKKYKKFVSQLTRKLDETNLSNARLFYTNRILDSDSLNERQRDRIVEAVSSANSVEEAKTIFETLQSAVAGADTNKKAPKSLNEAISKNSSAFLPRKEVKSSDPSVVGRMQKLAGIIKD